MDSVSHVACECGKEGLCVLPPALQDSWSRTFYEPLLVKNNAAALLASVPSSAEATAEIDCFMRPLHQFDQVGLFVSISDDCFVKAGLEYADGKLHLSVVVTNNGFSDWSTQVRAATPSCMSSACIRLPRACNVQKWHEWDGVTGSVRLRLSKLLRIGGPCLLVEVDTSRPGACATLGCSDGTGARAEATPHSSCGSAAATWSFVRIAPIHAPTEAVWRIGPFAAAPITSGFEATFRHFTLGDLAPPSHAADSSAMV